MESCYSLCSCSLTGVVAVVCWDAGDVGGLFGIKSGTIGDVVPST